MRILLVILLFISTTFFYLPDSYAQKTSSPLKPKSPPKQAEVGFLFGLGGNHQSGIYQQPNCDTCKFEGGNGVGYTLGFVFEQDFTSYLQWGASFRFVSKSIEASFLKTEDVNLVSIEDGDSYIRPIPFENTAEYDINSLSFQPHIKWSVFPWAFIRLGIGATYITSAHFTHTKELLKFSDTLDTGGWGPLELDGDNPKIGVVDDIDMPNISKIQFSLEPSIGFNFEISRQIYLSPVFQYSIPLTNLVSDQADFNISNWRILIELRMAIRLRNTEIL
jgi:outer membrane protein with beta-barrel domain